MIHSSIHHYAPRQRRTRQIVRAADVNVPESNFLELVDLFVVLVGFRLRALMAPAPTNGSRGRRQVNTRLEREYADLLERSKRGSESNENFCFRNLRRNNIWRHGSLSQRT